MIFIYNPLAPTFDEDPYPVYAYLRKHQPVFFWKDLKYWLLSKYNDVQASLTDPRLTTNLTLTADGHEATNGSNDLIGNLLERSPLRISDEKTLVFES